MAAELTTTLTGNVTISLDYAQAPGPYSSNMAFELIFSGDRRTVRLGNFPDITFHVDDGQGFQEDITVSKKSGGNGTFNMATGDIELDLELHIDHSFVLAGDSELPLRFTTGASASGKFSTNGSPLGDQTLALRLVACSKLDGGTLGGRDCEVTLAGSVDSTPFIVDNRWSPVYTMGDPGSGVGGFDLASPADRAFAYDWESSGRRDHIAFYRPGAGAFYVVKPNAARLFDTVFAVGAPGNGIGGFDIAESSDRAFAYDFDSSGRMDHVVFYRPGAGTIWILKRNGQAFTAVYAQGAPGNGIGAYDLASPADRAFALDWNSSGKADHIALYRPGSGTFYVVKPSSPGHFDTVYAEHGNGLGGYDLASPMDRAFAYDYDSSGRLDHIAFYRPGTGTFWILGRNGAGLSPVYARGDPGDGIGGYDLAEAGDRAFAFDYNGSSKLDHIVLYRPGAGTLWVVRRLPGGFAAVFNEGAPGIGVGGWGLTSRADRAFAYDYDRNGRINHLVLYHPGVGACYILKRN